MLYKNITGKIYGGTFTKEYGNEISIDDSTFEYVSKYIRPYKHNKDIKLTRYFTNNGETGSRINIHYFNDKSVYIWMYNDDYFLIKLEVKNSIILYYICDGFDGLLEFIKLECS